MPFCSRSSRSLVAIECFRGSESFMQSLGCRSAVVCFMFLVLASASGAQTASGDGAGALYQLDPAYEQEVSWAVGQLTGREVASMSCPPASELRHQMSFECTGRFADGESILVELKTWGSREVNILRINGEVPQTAEPAPEQTRVRVVASGIVSTAFGIALLVAAALMIGAGFRALARFLRLHRNQYVTGELAVVPQQRVSFPAPGSYTLYHRGSRRLFRDMLRYVPGLWDESASAYLSSCDVRLSGVRTAGLSTVQRPWKSFDVPTAGEYVLIVDGADERVRPSDRLIFGDARQSSLLFLFAGAMVGFLVGANALMVGIWLLAL
jgi:hypothetical protein